MSAKARTSECDEAEVAVVECGIGMLEMWRRDQGLMGFGSGRVVVPQVLEIALMRGQVGLRVPFVKGGLTGVAVHSMVRKF